MTIAGGRQRQSAEPERLTIKKHLMPRILPIAGGTVAILLLGLLIHGIAGFKSEPKHAGRHVVSVAVAPVLQKSVPVEIRTIGSVTAYSTIQVKSRVAGQIVRVYFKEGDYVSKGSKLFTIDPRTYQAALEQAEANLARDRAQVKQAEANLDKDKAQLHQAEANLARDISQQSNAEKEAARYAGLSSQGAVSLEQYDQMKTNADSMRSTLEADRAAIENVKAALKADQAAFENVQATVRADRALVENKKVELSYTEIRSPVDGRTGSLLIHNGNVVKENDLSLLVINQVQPIYITFAAPESALVEIRKYEAGGKIGVRAVIGDDEQPIAGKISFSDNAVDAATGTIKLKAVFDNSDRRLWPGQFVNVIFTLACEPNAILIPSQAVQSGQEGNFVFIVKQDMTVELRPIEVKRSFDGQTVVKSGLKAGQTVVTDGQLQLIPGTRVKVKSPVSDVR